MKRLTVLLALAVLFLVAASANAENYKVRKGDCLSKIAMQFHTSVKKLHNANKQIKNIDLIYAGQTLTIPTSSPKTKAQIVSSNEFKPLNSLGVNPFGKRDQFKAIGMFSLPEEVKQAFVTKVKNGEYEWSYIKRGDRFREMFFANYRILKNRIANWDSTWQEAIRLYKVEHQGVEYLLYDPLKCRNLAWWSNKIVAQVPIVQPVEKPPEVAVVAPPPPPEPEKVKPIELPPVVEVKPEIVTIVKECPGCQPEVESYAWGGRYESLRGNGGSNFYGGKVNLYFCPHDTFFGRMREGVGATVNGWDGENDGYGFRGNRWSAGPVIDITNKQGSRFVSTVQLGKQEEYGHDHKGYDANQETKMLYVGQTADFYFNGPIFKVENWVDANFDIDHEKQSNWKGWKIPEANDKAGDKTSFSAGSRIYFWQTENLHGGVTLKGSYANEDHVVGVEAGPFISDSQDIIKLGVGFRHQFNSIYESNNGNSVMAGIDLDVVKTIKKIVSIVTTTDEKEVVK